MRRGGAASDVETQIGSEGKERAERSILSASGSERERRGRFGGRKTHEHVGWRRMQAGMGGGGGEREREREKERDRERERESYAGRER